MIKFQKGDLVITNEYAIRKAFAKKGIIAKVTSCDNIGAHLDRYIKCDDNARENNYWSIHCLDLINTKLAKVLYDR